MQDIAPIRPNGWIRLISLMPLRACLKIAFWVAQATGLCRQATRRTEWGAHRQRIRTDFCWAQPCSFRSAGRRPERAGRPCYPFFKRALRFTSYPADAEGMQDIAPIRMIGPIRLISLM